MNHIEKINELKSVIKKELAPLITNDYVLWGLPYYSNIGDTLIWEGELEFLKTLPYKCVGTCGWNEYESKALSKDTIILIQGGGYFGDVWRLAWEYVLNTIEHYPDNRIILLPNTIFYNDVELMRSDAERMAKLKHLTICVRDRKSYKIAKENFKNEVRLVPDMAFYISLNYLEKWSLPETEKVLYLKWIDKELGAQDICIKAEHIDVRDWPTMDDEPSIGERVFYKGQALYYKTRIKYVRLHAFAEWLERMLAYHVYRKCLTRRGVEFVSQYKEIYTTRLHVMILSVLLGKKACFIDNNYGKLSSFYSTWLDDCDCVGRFDG